MITKQILQYKGHETFEGEEVAYFTLSYKNKVDANIYYRKTEIKLVCTATGTIFVKNDILELMEEFGEFIKNYYAEEVKKNYLNGKKVQAMSDYKTYVTDVSLPVAMKELNEMYGFELSNQIPNVKEVN